MAEIPRLWSRLSGRDSDSRSPFRPGDKVDDRYLIDGYIARGGMSVVYRAIDTRLDRPLALKVLRSDLASREEFRKRFVAEAKTVANLRGPGIVTVSEHLYARHRRDFIYSIIFSVRSLCSPYCAAHII